ncbi:MAG: MFS transporter [Chloroflexi bacterium]|nr:MFS transporter [Chloroflexota bacterium]
MDNKVAFNFKLYYFFRFMGQGFFYPFLVLYLNHKGIAGGQLGLLMMMLPFGKLLLSPVSGYLSDLYRVHKQVLIGSVFVTFAGASYLFFTAPTFPVYFLSILIITLGEVSVDSLINTLAIDYLSRSDRQTDFGRWRLWGALGFMVGSFFLGLFELDLTLNLVPLLFAGTNLISFIVAFTLPKASARKPTDWLGGIKLVTQNRSFLLLLIGVVLSGLSFNIVFTYYSVYMRGIGASSWLIGLGVAMQTIVEIILSANTKNITERFSLRRIYLLGFALLPVRSLLYIINRSPFIGLMIQNLHGFYIFSAFIIGIIVLDLNLKPEWRSTGQSYYYSAFGGFGATIGALIAPMIFDAQGISVLYTFALVVAFAGFLLIQRATLKLIPKSEALLQSISK